MKNIISPSARPKVGQQIITRSNKGTQYVFHLEKRSHCALFPYISNYLWYYQATCNGRTFKAILGGKDTPKVSQIENAFTDQIDFT